MNLLIGFNAKSYDGEWDPNNPNYSTNYKYDAAKAKAPGPFLIFQRLLANVILPHLRPTDQAVAAYDAVNANANTVAVFNMPIGLDPITETGVDEMVKNPMPVITKLVIAKS